MKFRFAATLALVATSLLLPSCATKFTAAQKAQLRTVAVTKTSVDSGAYEEPYGGDTGARDATAASTGLIGLAVGSAISGTQNSMSRSANGHHFNAVQKNTPSNLPDRLQTKLSTSLKSDSFFKSRVRPTSENVVTSEITCYRLVRTGKNQSGELLFTPQVYVDIYLKDRAGKNLVGRRYLSVNPSLPVYAPGLPLAQESATVSQYAASSEKTKKAYEAALDSAVSQFSAELAQKTAE